MASSAGQYVDSGLDQARGQDRQSQRDLETRIGGYKADQRLISQIDRVDAIGPYGTVNGAAFDIEVKHDRRRAVGAGLVDYGLICSLELRRRATRRVGCQFRPKRSAERDYYVPSRAADALDQRQHGRAIWQSIIGDTGSIAAPNRRAAAAAGDDEAESERL